MTLILYHTSPCSHTPAIQRVVKFLGVQCEFKAVSATELAQVPDSIYKDGPILLDQGKVIEDWRLIIRYLNEVHGSHKLTGASPTDAAAVFALCEEIELKLLEPAQTLITPPENSGLRAFLKPLLGKKSALHSTISDAEKEDLVKVAIQLGNDPRLKDPQFVLAQMVLDGAIEFLRSDPFFASRMESAV